MLIPSIQSARLATARLDRQFDALQCIESIRMYAHTHNSVLPERLDELVDAPVPIDPVTGKPFNYQRTSQTSATLFAPAPPGGPEIPQFMIRYQLNVTK
jgi:hypothetical protein